MTYPSAETVESDASGEDRPNYPDEILNTSRAGSSLLDRKLTLKIGFPMTLPRNVDLFIVHLNGARRIVKALQSILLLLESLTGDNADTMLAFLVMPYGPGDRSFHFH